jgi:hypothetical protein
MTHDRTSDGRKNEVRKLIKMQAGKTRPANGSFPCPWCDGMIHFQALRQKSIAKCDGKKCVDFKDGLP